MRLNRSFAVLLVHGALVGLVSVASAVPYASNVRNTGGTNWEFVLNAPAENVTILRDGNPLDLGGLAAGRHPFSMSGFTDWDIQVTTETPISPWTPIGDPVGNTHAHFEQPTGVVVNTNPGSEFFGTIYVGNARTSNTASERPMGDGIYALTANQRGVNLDPASGDYTYFQETFDFDTSQAKAFWTISSTGTASTWKMTIDEGDNLIIGDFATDTGGMKYASRNLTSGGLVFATEGSGAIGSGGVVNGEGVPFHSATASKPYVTGTVGVDLTVWAMDEGLHQDRLVDPGSGAAGNHIWRWDVGSETNHDTEPTLVINQTTLARTTDNRQVFLPNNQGVRGNAHYDPANDIWYMTENRSNGNEAGLVAVSGSGTVLWSSLQHSIDNNLDGHSTLTDGGGACNIGSGTCAIQDMFRGMGGGLTLSPDGTKLYLMPTDRQNATRSTNPYFGNPDRGSVFIIPLDENGIPDIEITGSGAGMVTNIEFLSIGAGSSTSGSRDLAVDIVGNLYVVDANPETLNVFSPGGSWIATTSSDGTFTLDPFSTAAPGDHNLDGVVDAADYVTWRKNPGAYGNAQGYTDWSTHFGEGGEGAGGGGAVPEPGTLALVALGLVMVAGRARTPKRSPVCRV